MPTDPGNRCPVRRDGHQCLSNYGHPGTHNYPPPAPSARRAQIPEEALEAATLAFKAHMGDPGPWSDTIHLALAAAAPVLLSEYQQRIEAAEAIPAKPHAFHAHPDSRLAGWIDGYNYARDNFRAALGSTKPAGSE